MGKNNALGYIAAIIGGFAAGWSAGSAYALKRCADIGIYFLSKVDESIDKELLRQLLWEYLGRAGIF